MAYIEKRTNAAGKVSFRVQVRMKGFPIQSATFERKTDAKSWASKKETELREGRHFPTSHAKRHTVADLIDRYIDEILPRKPDATKEGQLKWWKKNMGDRVLADVTVDVIASLRERLLIKAYDTQGKKFLSPSSANRYVAALSSAFTTAVQEWRWLQTNPVRNLPKLGESPGRTRYLDDEELSRLLVATKQSANPFLHLIVVLAVSVGSRKSNIVGLKWKDVDLKRGLLIFERTKSGAPHRVPLRGLALKMMGERHRTRDKKCPYVFPNPDGTKPIDIRTAWTTALRRAKIKKFTFHDLRHSCATFLAMQGASLHEIAEVLGHSSLEMTRRYSHLTETRVGDTVGQMNDRIFGDE